MRNPKELLLRNVFSNWFALVVNASVSFLLSPFLVKHLGTEAFGIWMLIFSIVNYMSFFDLGVQLSLARYIPKYYAVEDYDNLNRVLNTSHFIYAIVASVVMLITGIIAFVFVDSFNVSAELIPVMRWSLLLIGANGAVLFLGIAAASLGPFHRYDLRTAVTVTTKIAGTLLIVYFVLQGYSLIAMALITLIMTVIRLFASRILQQKIVPAIRFGVKYIDRKMMKQLFNYGTYSFLITVTTLIIFNSDNVIIGLFLTASTVTYYSLAITILSYLRTLMSAIGMPLVPAISHLEATSDLTEVASTSFKILKYLFYLSFAVCASIFLFGGSFVTLWMGPGFELTTEILRILVVTAALYLPQVTSNSILLGISRHKPLFYILLAEAVANIVLSVILVQYIGVYGVALGLAIPQLIIYSVVYPVIYHRILEAPVGRFYKEAAVSASLALIATVPTALLVEYLLVPSNWLIFIVDVVIVTSAILVGFALFILEPYDRQRLLTKVGIKF